MLSLNQIAISFISLRRKTFKRLTNRSTCIDLVDFQITFDKVSKSVTIESIDFEDWDLESLMEDQTFLGQLINMVETYCLA